MVRITNRGGPDTASNATVTLGCMWTSWSVVQGSGEGDLGTFGLDLTITSLGPNQTAEFDTGFTVDLTQFWHTIGCDMVVPFNDPDTGNNRCDEDLPEDHP